MPIETPNSVTPDVCCFCGQAVQHLESEGIHLSAHWLEGGHEKSQSWIAHHTCLGERLHDSMSGTGPFLD
jgi:hypothetical protein